MSTEMELPEPDEEESDLQVLELTENELLSAKPEHVELLYIAGITRYGDLKRFDSPEELLSFLEDRVRTYDIIDLPTRLPKKRIREWLNQANSEHPGTIITKPSPGGRTPEEEEEEEDEPPTAPAAE